MDYCGKVTAPMTSLDMRQLNTLKTGTDLAAEIPASSAQLRAFVVVSAYAIDEQGKRKDVSKFLNAANQEIRFWVERYEVDKILINNWITYDDVNNLTRHQDIITVTELETILATYIDDFALLAGLWNCDNPLP